MAAHKTNQVTVGNGFHTVEENDLKQQSSLLSSVALDSALAFLARRIQLQQEFLSCTIPSSASYQKILIKK